jgi:hypothetical protein
MKKGLLMLAVAMMAGILAFVLSRGQPAADTDPVLLDSLPELAWLRTDLKLTDEQFSKVEQLHREYRPVCAELCRRIAESEAAVAKLAGAQGGMSDDLANAIENHGRVIAECKRGMLEHLYQTASLMDERQARRYLEVTLPLALDSARGRTASRCHE